MLCYVHEKINVGWLTAMLLNNSSVCPFIPWHDVQIIGMRRWLMLQWTLSSASEKLHTPGNIAHALNMNRYWERRELCNIKTCGWIRAEVLNGRIIKWIRSSMEHCWLTYILLWCFWRGIICIQNTLSWTLSGRSENSDLNGRLWFN